MEGMEIAAVSLTGIKAKSLKRMCFCTSILSLLIIDKKCTKTGNFIGLNYLTIYERVDY